MKIRFAILIVAALMLSTSAWAATEVFKELNWEDQPWAPYTSAAVSIDTLGSMVVSSATGDGGSAVSKLSGGWIPGQTLSESWGGAKLQATGPFSGLHTRVYDPRTTGQHGWSVVFATDNGNWMDFGCRANTGIAMTYARMYVASEATWYNVAVDDRQSGDKYYTLDFVRNPSGTFNITSYEYFVSTGATNTITWETATQASGGTPITFGNITDIYLTASSTNRTNMNYKYTEFTATPAVPEPASLIALFGGVAGLAGYVIRRRK